MVSIACDQRLTPSLNAVQRKESVFFEPIQ